MKRLGMILAILLVLGLAVFIGWAKGWAYGIDDIFESIHTTDAQTARYILMEPREVSNDCGYMREGRNVVLTVYCPPTITVYVAVYFDTMDEVLSYLNDQHKASDYVPEVYEVKPVRFKCNVTEKRTTRQVEDVDKKYDWVKE